MPELCPTHGIPLVSSCPACAGSKGGKVGSKAQLKQRAEALKKAHRARRKP